jgi:hypothetical protein
VGQGTKKLKASKLLKASPPCIMNPGLQTATILVVTNIEMEFRFVK